MYSVIYDDIINLFLSTNRDYCLLGHPWKEKCWSKVF